MFHTVLTLGYLLFHTTKSILFLFSVSVFTVLWGSPRSDVLRLHFTSSALVVSLPSCYSLWLVVPLHSFGVCLESRGSDDWFFLFSSFFPSLRVAPCFVLEYLFAPITMLLLAYSYVCSTLSMLKLCVLWTQRVLKSLRPFCSLFHLYPEFMIGSGEPR
jgi:hypothetical protein